MDVNGHEMVIHTTGLHLHDSKFPHKRSCLWFADISILSDEYQIEKITMQCT